MTYKWIDDIGVFSNLAGEWDNALISSGSYNPFLLSDFIITWWKYFYDEGQLRIFTAYDGRRLSGGMPLYLRSGGAVNGFVKVLRHIGDAAANYTEPFYTGDKPELIALFKNALLENNDWDMLSLPNVRAESNIIADSNYMDLHRDFFLYVRQDHMNWAIDLSGGIDEYYAATLSKKLRRYLRSRRRLAESKYGKICLREAKGPEDVGKQFDIYTRLSLDSFSGRGRLSAFHNSRYSSFLKEFFTAMSRKQRLDAHVLFAGDHMLAVSFGYRFGRGFNWAFTAFNYEFKHISPGYLLIEELIKETARRGESYYNWYGFEQFYKRQWCNCSSPLYRFYLSKRSVKGLLSYKLFMQGANMLRSNRVMVSMSRKIRKS